MGTYKQFTGNAAATTLSGAITGTPTTFSTNAATGFPTGAGSVPFVVCVDRGTSSEEKILCSSLSGTVFTIQTRGWDSTISTDHALGATVEHVLDADTLNDSQQHIHSTSRYDHDTQYLRRDGSTALTGVTTIAAAPGNSAVGDAAAKGSGPTLALSDHVHGREAFGTPGNSAVGDTAAAGAAATVARSDHVHGREGFGTPGTSHAADSPASGSASTVARSDHVHGRVAPAASPLVTASESCTSTSYGKLTTTTDKVTFTVPASGNVKVTLTAAASYTSGPNQAGWVSVALSGANTVAASDNNSVQFTLTTIKTSGSTQSAVYVLTGLTAGSTTFDMEYKSSTSSTITFSDRQIIVEEA